MKLLNMIHMEGVRCLGHWKEKLIVSGSLLEVPRRNTATSVSLLSFCRERLCPLTKYAAFRRDTH